MTAIPQGAKKPSDRLKAEAKAEEATADDGYFVVDFKGVPLRVLPFLDWDMDAMSHLNAMNFNLWAPGALHPEDVREFARIKANNREALAFIKEAAAEGGGDLGELFAS